MNNKTCDKCGNTKNLNTDKFCRECGSDLVKKCPECQSIRDGKSKFCGECGHRFRDEKVNENLEKIATHKQVEIKEEKVDVKETPKQPTPKKKKEKNKLEENENVKSNKTNKTIDLVVENIEKVREIKKEVIPEKELSQETKLDNEDYLIRKFIAPIFFKDKKVDGTNFRSVEVTSGSFSSENKSKSENKKETAKISVEEKTHEKSLDNKKPNTNKDFQAEKKEKKKNKKAEKITFDLKEKSPEEALAALLGDVNINKLAKEQEQKEAERRKKEKDDLMYTFGESSTEEDPKVVSIATIGKELSEIDDQKSITIDEDESTNTFPEITKLFDEDYLETEETIVEDVAKEEMNVDSNIVEDKTILVSEEDSELIDIIEDIDDTYIEYDEYEEYDEIIDEFIDDENVLEAVEDISNEEDEYFEESFDAQQKKQERDVKTKVVSLDDILDKSKQEPKSLNDLSSEETLKKLRERASIKNSYLVDDEDIEATVEVEKDENFENAYEFKKYSVDTSDEFDKLEEILHEKELEEDVEEQTKGLVGRNKIYKAARREELVNKKRTKNTKKIVILEEGEYGDPWYEDEAPIDKGKDEENKDILQILSENPLIVVIGGVVFFMLIYFSVFV